MKLSGAKYTLEQTISMLAYDKLSILLWLQTKDGRKGKNRPVSLYEQLVCKQENQEIKSFCTAENFERERKRILEKGG